MRHQAMLAAIAITIAASIASTTAAQAQSVDQAHATVNRLLDGAGDVVVMRGGKTLDAYFTLHDVRTSGRCTTTYKGRIPVHPDIPAKAHGTSGEGEIQWSELRDTRVSGRDFHRRSSVGVAHFRFSSPAAAARFSDAADTIMEACGSKQKADEQAAEETVYDPRGYSASLAIDRRNGSAYGWAIDHKSLAASDSRALAECKGRGPGCQVVLRFTGGCGAYAADQTRGNSVYGWGTATTRAGAEERAWNEARKRGATNLVTRVWGCNSTRPGGETSATAATSGQPATGPSATGQATSGQAAGGRTRTGLSDEVIRRNAEAIEAHQKIVNEYRSKLDSNQQKIAAAVAERRAVQEAHERELAKANAARAQFERERQAYREEYKRVTGRYPD